MKLNLVNSLLFSFAISATFFPGLGLCAQEQATESTSEQEMEEMELSGGKFLMQAPSEWKMIEAKSSMIEFEFKIPMSDGDESERDGRLTIMPAGGSIEANIDRWKGQFSQPDGSSTGDSTKVEEIEVDGMTAHMVDITGTFAERAQMTAPPTMRDNYRMLAAIVEAGSQKYFIKFYGGNATVQANQELFENFVKSFSKGDK